MSQLVLHRAVASPPARACMVLADILQLRLHYRDYNIFKKETKTKEFMKLNPMGTVPVLEDGDFVVSESNAIMKYLLGKYGGEHLERLYPTALQPRALVDQCMYFTAGVLFPAFRAVGRDTVLLRLEAPTETHKAEIARAYRIIEAYLQSRPYIALDRLTLADLSAGTTVSAIQVMHKLDKDKFPRTFEWLARLNEESSFGTINKEGAEYFWKMFTAFWEKNKRDNAKLKA